MNPIRQTLQKHIVHQVSVKISLVVVREVGKVRSTDAESACNKFKDMFAAGDYVINFQIISVAIATL